MIPLTRFYGNTKQNMEQFRLNIDKVTNIETLFNAGWLFADKRSDEIILESETSDIHPAILKALLIILCEGILNSNAKSKEERKEVNFDEIKIPDFKTLAKELTRVTGIRFSTAIIK